MVTCPLPVWWQIVTLGASATELLASSVLEVATSCGGVTAAFVLETLKKRRKTTTKKVPPVSHREQLVQMQVKTSAFIMNLLAPAVTSRWHSTLEERTRPAHAGALAPVSDISLTHIRPWCRDNPLVMSDS
jgi:hypothetical protein